MAAPNIVNVSSIYGSTVGKNINNTADSDVTVLEGRANKVLKVNIIRAANVHPTENDSLTINFVDSASNSFSLVQDMEIAIRQALPALEGSIYLSESDKITMRRLNNGNLASDSATIHGIISFEELDDA